MAGRTTSGRKLCGQLAYDVACLQRIAYRHVAQSMATTCHPGIGLKLCCWPESTPRPLGRGRDLGRAAQPGCHHMCLVIYMENIIFKLICIVCWGVDRVGA
jgi:hypothetical protein